MLEILLYCYFLIACGFMLYVMSTKKKTYIIYVIVIIFVISIILMLFILLLFILVGSSMAR